MRIFVRTLYKYDFEGEVVEEEEEGEIVIPVEIDNDEENTQDDDPVEVSCFSWKENVLLIKYFIFATSAG